jgi:hypothetical protein
VYPEDFGRARDPGSTLSAISEWVIRKWIGSRFSRALLLVTFDLRTRPVYQLGYEARSHGRFGVGRLTSEVVAP